MNTFVKASALSLFAMTAATTAFADGHETADMVTCAEFAALDRQEQTSTLNELYGEVEGVERDDDTISSIMLSCNGNDEKALADVLEQQPQEG
ncbi:hypothetical protein FHS72_000493 [Loktanella ponticola]|uniref:Uncharacterized protein n=1 Tax=Yoonia ponticola TaxID=1524255 RepID=A0A7W9BI16_9RHOB|nr:hypothetical protein [Yoonia ponticola]MBB5720889.1 hypothetical protein [Yoonia ponticola]